MNYKTMVREEVFYKIKELCKFEQTDTHQYNKLVRVGKLICPNTNGFVDVCIFYQLQKNEHIIRIYFGNMDDGVVGSFTTYENEEEALVKLNQLKNWLTEIDEFDTFEEINKSLNEIGLYVEYES